MGCIDLLCNRIKEGLPTPDLPNNYRKPRFLGAKVSAFTLIELLVVIAIIAILAAILFPVFAQAKEAAKKVADLSQIKETAVAVLEYNTDSDDLYPLESGIDAFTGVWGYNRLQYVPADWRLNAPRDVVDQSKGFFLNSIYPYTKSYAITRSVGTEQWQISAYNQFSLNPASMGRKYVSYAYNGLLNSYSSSGIASPSDCPLVTEMNGNKSMLGLGQPNPVLTCAIPGLPCVYQPPEPGCNPSSSSINGSVSYMNFPYTNDGSTYAGMWVYSGGQNWSFTDSHAKFRHIGQAVYPNQTDRSVDPYTGYASNGQFDPNHTTAYMDPIGGCHPYLFRPDFTGSN